MLSSQTKHRSWDIEQKTPLCGQYASLCTWVRCPVSFFFNFSATIYSSFTFDGKDYYLWEPLFNNNQVMESIHHKNNAMLRFESNYRSTSFSIADHQFFSSSNICHVIRTWMDGEWIWLGIDCIGMFTRDNTMVLFQIHGSLFV